MDDKQLQILAVAQRLFEEQGIQQTSVNDIAKECKMSKATFYKYFKSKETMITDIIFLNEQQLLDSIRKLNEDNDINGREKLKQKIRFFWDYSYSRGIYGAYILDNFTELEQQEMRNLFKTGRNVIIEQYKDSLREAFGVGIGPIMGDLILCMEGMIREFIYLSYAFSSRIEADVVIRYVFTMLDAIVEARGNQQGIIDESQLYDSDKQQQYRLYEDQFKQALMRINEKIGELSSDAEKRDKLLEAIVLIEKEARAKQYRSLLMDALLALLGREPDLSTLVAELEQHRTNF